MKDIAIPYSRFSDPTQAEGDSETRQRTMFLRFCERHKLRPAKGFKDRGLSGYHGKHRTKGEFGQLEELAKRGAYKGAVLVVESWDRLGRLRPDRQLELITGLLKAGLRIGICRLDDIFSQSDFGTSHKWVVLSVFVQLAFEESRQKADRVAHSWKSRRQQARETGEPVCTWVPAWLRVVDGKIETIPERVAVVKEIFRLAAAGYGVQRIASKFNQDGVPAFGNSKRWSSTYIGKILKGKEVVGEWQPGRWEEQPDGTRRKVKDGPPLKDYYPRVITQTEYDLARNDIRDRCGHMGPRQRTYINVFQGLCRSILHEDDHFLLDNKGTAAKPLLYLVNTIGRNGGCEQVRFSYPIFEKAILRLLKEVPASVVAPSEPISEVDTLQARHDALLADIEGMKDALRKRFSPAIVEVLAEKEAEYGPVKEALDRAIAEAMHPLADTWKDGVDLCDAVEQGGEEAKLRLRAALKRCIDAIWLHIYRKGIDAYCFVEVQFRSGSTRLFAIGHRRPHNTHTGVRDGFWWASSEAIEGQGGIANDPKVVQFLEQWVMNAGPDAAKGKPGKFIREVIRAG